ncbi:MAG: tetratricopeptide repeat protein [Desulfobacteraceae bacterium]|nr:tetratricopeptide repeat protein [Desulfobacteraceae bacterium]
MKKIAYILFASFFLISCASKSTTTNTRKKQEIATATQRVGEEYYNAGKYTIALKNLLEAHKTIPDDPYLNNSLGLVYMAKNRYDLAQNHFKKALKLNSDFSQAKNNLGATYLKQKKWALAIECFEEVSENLLYPTPEIPLSNIGWAYFHQKLFSKAKKYFKQSLEIRPNFLYSIHGLASIYIESGKHAQAIGFLHHKLKRNPGAAILHSDLAKAYEATNEFDKAKRSWNLVLKLVPEDSPLAKEAQKKLYNLD